MNDIRVRTIRSLVILGAVCAMNCGSDDKDAAAADAAVDAPRAALAGDAGVDAPRTAVEGDAGAEGDALESDAQEPDGGAVEPIRGMVVTHSDYQSASVSLLDRDGNVVKDGCINSGTGGAGLSMTLSGDLALPSQIGRLGAIPLLDRGNHALVWIDASSCAPVRQLAVGTGFKSNPHDYLEISPTKAYVTRYSQNTAATPAPGDFDDGNDLLVVDPSAPRIVGRIDLAPHAPAGVLPRADRAVFVDGKVYVSLNASDAKFGSNATGRILTIDPATDSVTGAINLPGTKNCGALAPVPGTKKLVVACSGDYGDGAAQAAASAIVTVDVATNPPTVVATIGAAAIDGRVLSNQTLAAMDDGSVLVVSAGEFSNTPPDTLWALSAAGTPSKVFSSAEGFSLGALLVDVERGRVFVADGTMGTPSSVRIFDRTAGVLTAVGSVKSNPGKKLPPRWMAWF